MEDITRKRLLSSQRTGNELLVLPTNSDRLKVLGLVDNREMYKVMCQGNKSSIFDNDVSSQVYFERISCLCHFPALARKWSLKP